MKKPSFRRNHLDELKRIACPEQGEIGHKVRAWGEWLLERGDAGLRGLVRLSTLPTGRLNRADVFDIVGDSKVSTAECCFAIAAWGSMHRDHGRQAFEAFGRWGHIAEALRDGSMGRQEAYDAFWHLRPNDLPGMGPAYYTKIIYFLMAGRARCGYIMDQWSARSLNLLLCAGPHVTLYRSGNRMRVSDSNTADTYEQFCVEIEELAQELGCSPEIAEERIYSEGRGWGSGECIFEKLMDLGKY